MNFREYMMWLYGCEERIRKIMSDSTARRQHVAQWKFNTLSAKEKAERVLEQIERIMSV